jgi:hypothetical protein
MSTRLGYIPDHAATRITAQPPVPTTDTPASEPEPTRMRGLGDLVHRVLDAVGVVKFVKAREQQTGRECGCKRRREALNRAVPFGGAGAAPEPSASRTHSEQP